MNEGYCALYLSIIKGYTPEQAFEVLETGKPTRRVDPIIVEEMLYLHGQGLTYREIGKIYGISADAVSHRIYRFRKKKIAAQ